jgi:hypothetical protein
MKNLFAIGMTMLLLVCPMAARSEGGKHEHSHKMRELLMSLSPADREKYETAKKRALANRKVAAAHERRRKADAEYKKLLHREMLKTDPSLAPLLEKISELRKKDDL